MTLSKNNECILTSKYYMYSLKANMVVSPRGDILGTIDTEALIT